MIRVSQQAQGEIIHEQCASSGLIWIAQQRPVPYARREASGERLEQATLPELNLAQSVITRGGAKPAIARQERLHHQPLAPGRCASPVCDHHPQEFAAAKAARHRLDDLDTCQIEAERCD